MTAVIGAGVLALPYSVAWLGWIAGPLLLTVFYLLTWMHASLLAAVVAREQPQPVSYGEAVRRLLGPRAGLAISALQLTINALAGVAYTVAAAACARAVRHALSCPHAVECEPAGQPSTVSGPWVEALVFGIVQLAASQLRSLDEATWSSLIGTVTSLIYSAAALGLSIAQVRSPWRGSKSGVPTESVLSKSMGALDALGAMAFAFAFPTVLVEVQATIRPRRGKAAGAQMQTAIRWSLAIAFVFYLGVGIAGYAAFGDTVADNVLAIPHVGPVAVLIVANAAVVIHLCSAYQVYSQPVFAAIERAMSGGPAKVVEEDREAGGLSQPLLPSAEDDKENTGQRQEHALTHAVDDDRFPAIIPGHDVVTEVSWVQRLLVRSTYVIATTAIAAALPCFAQILGLIGALLFWPAGIFFPVAMYIKAARPRALVRRGLKTLCAVLLIVSLAIVTASVHSLAVKMFSWS